MLVAFNGTVANTEKLIELNPVAFSAMNTAVDFYASGSASCAALDVSFAEWNGAIREVGHLRALSQKSSSQFLLANFLDTDRDDLTATIREIELSLRRLNFGSGSFDIPAPPTQAVADHVLMLQGLWSSFQDRLEAYDVSAMANTSLAMLAEVENAMNRYMQAALESDPTIPAQRQNIASRQVMLAHKMVKESLLVRLGHSNWTEDLGRTIDLFEVSHHALRYGGGSLQKMLPERKSLRQRWGRVDEIWKGFMPQVLSIASGRRLSTNSSLDVLRMQTTLSSLVEELDASVVLYGILDPIIPPPVQGFPWTILVYCFIGASLCLCGGRGLLAAHRAT
jgi:hypothetical protein